MRRSENLIMAEKFYKLLSFPKTTTLFPQKLSNNIANSFTVWSLMHSLAHTPVQAFIHAVDAGGEASLH